MFDARWDDPRDRDGHPRDVEVHWVELAHASEEDVRHLDDDVRERAPDPRERDHDPRDPFIEGLELPRGLEREYVIDGDRHYELNGDDVRSLAGIGAFRVVAEHDLYDPRDEDADARERDLLRLEDEGLIRFVSLDGDARAVTLTEHGEHLLESHRHERDDERGGQAFYADVSRPRELSHDAELDFAYYSGWRRGEISGLTWREVDMTGGVIRLDPDRSKTTTGRVLPMSQPLKEVLTRRVAARRLDCQLVFHRDGQPLLDWRKAWAAACKAAKLDGKHLHDCRRTAARNLIRSGTPERVAMQLTGHKTRSVFDRYNIVSESDLRAGVDRLAAYVNKLPKERNVELLDQTAAKKRGPRM